MGEAFRLDCRPRERSLPSSNGIVGLSPELDTAWRVPGGRRFRVRTEDGRVFELFYGELYDEWRIHLPWSASRDLEVRGKFRPCAPSLRTPRSCVTSSRAVSPPSPPPASAASSLSSPPSTTSSPSAPANP